MDKNFVEGVKGSVEGDEDGKEASRLK